MKIAKRIVIYRTPQKAELAQKSLKRDSREGDTPVLGASKQYGGIRRVVLLGIAALNGR